MKYLPPNDLGEKPYVVTIRDWGRERDRFVYARTALEARYVALGRPGPGTYVVHCRRATIHDKEREL